MFTNDAKLAKFDITVKDKNNNDWTYTVGRRKQRALRWLMGSVMLLHKTITSILLDQPFFPIDIKLAAELKLLDRQLSKVYIQIKKQMENIK